MSLIVPPGFRPILDIRKTERAIPKIKGFFEARLAENLNLERVSAPMFVRAGKGINDDLNGTERKVSFDAGDEAGVILEVVNSLAKWKRMALARYGYNPGEGIWTDMNAIRRDEVRDNLHSFYVDQWDWERVVTAEQRNVEFLQMIVRKIYDAITKTERMMRQEYDISCVLPERIAFVTTEELEARHPTLSRKDRENMVAEAEGAVFLMQIGWPLKDGQSHDGRAPDYDDWNLNGDIIVWNPVLRSAFELSSMGIRVDQESLVKQLTHASALSRLDLEFHKMLVQGELPLSVGGGVGQSRLSMFLTRAAHIGQVQASDWPEDMVRRCLDAGIPLL